MRGSFLALAACCLGWQLSTRSMAMQRQPMGYSGRPPIPIRTLLIDNYDSYTYNIFQLLAEINGAEPRVIYNNAFSSWEQCLLHIPENTYDNVVISPGPGHPSVATDFGICTDCILLSNKPVLGVCLGHQGIVTAYGGTVSKAPQPMHGRLSPVHHDDQGLFRALPQPFSAVRYHSLVAQRPLPQELEETAWTCDDNNVMMGVRHRHRQVYGVQFHPESIRTQAGRQLFSNFRDITLNSSQIKTSSSGSSSSSSGSTSIPPLPEEGHDREHDEGSVSAGGDCWVEKVGPLAMGSEQLFSGLFGSSAVSFWLDSASSSGGSGSGNMLSFMGSCDGGGYAAEYRGSNELLLLRRGASTQHMRANIFEFLRGELSSHPQRVPQLGASVGGQPLPFNITRAFFGYIGYENRHEAATIMQSSSSSNSSSFFNYSSTHHSSFEGSSYTQSQPQGLLLCPEAYIVYDHITRCAYIVCSTESSAAELAQRVRDMESALPHQAAAVAGVLDSSVSGELRSSETRQQYEQSIHRCLDLISSGETYEVCLTTQFTGERSVTNSACVSGAARHLEAYRMLRRRNPAPLASFFHYDPQRLSGGSGEAFSILSSSPERFLSCLPGGELESRPIKGTARRCLDDAATDALIAQALGNDEKSLAENLMVLDLVRNDFGRVCCPGSVAVPALMKVETYASVHQLVSAVRGTLRKGLNVVDAIVATFPGGSMTGAPKVRTMDIIDSIERRPRGVYSGCIGYIGCNGVADLNVVIRTALFKSRSDDSDSVTIAGGGAVVALSDPRAEVEEVLIKGRAVATALGLSLKFREDSSSSSSSSSSSEDVSSSSSSSVLSS